MRAMTPITPRGATKDPVASRSMPITMGVMMPAKLEAKFWMPPMDPTCLELGATSAGSDQMPVPATVRLL